MKALFTVLDLVKKKKKVSPRHHISVHTEDLMANPQTAAMTVAGSTLVQPETGVFAACNLQGKFLSTRS